MGFHEFFGTVPECGDRLHVLVQTQDKAVLLFVVLHEFERVVMDVTEQLDTWFYPPVVFELVHERVSEEKARLEATHMPIADRVAVDNLPLGHILTNFSCFVLVNERWE